MGEPLVEPAQQQPSPRLHGSCPQARALVAARRLYGEAEAAEAVRMRLDYDRLPPEVLCDGGMIELTKLYSGETGDYCQPRPATAILLPSFAGTPRRRRPADALNQALVLSQTCIVICELKWAMVAKLAAKL